MGLKEKIQNLSDEYYEEIREIRCHLHKHPELSFQEHETAKYISSILSKWGVEHTTGIVETGIVVLLEGSNPDSYVTALRADIDALPIVENSTSDYKSCNKGVMHACGHDVHSASLLGAIKILNSLKNEWKGTIKCLFQPGEERLPGGASLMIKEGVLENPKPQRIFGQHVFPELTAGKIGIKSGLYMASADEIYLKVKGKGGHGAIPHKNIDPVLIASHIIVGLQQVVSRNCNPEIPSVLSFGRIIGEGSTNVIPDEVNIQGTYRTLDEKWRFEAHKHIEEMASGIAKSMGAECEVDIRVGYPFLINDEELSEKAKADAIKYLGEENVVDLPIRMTGEDFAYFSQVMPGCFYRLGTSSPDGSNSFPVHNSKFDIDPKALKTGMGLMAWMAVS